MYVIPPYMVKKSWRFRIMGTVAKT